MMVHFLPTHRYSGLHIILPNDKIIFYNNSMYFSNNKLHVIPNENSNIIKTIQTVQTNTVNITNRSASPTITIPNVSHMLFCILTPVQVICTDMTQRNDSYKRTANIYINNIDCGAITWDAYIETISQTVDISINYCNIVYPFNDAYAYLTGRYITQEFTYGTYSSINPIISLSYSEGSSNYTNTGKISCVYKIQSFYIA